MDSSDSEVINADLPNENKPIRVYQTHSIKARIAEWVRLKSVEPNISHSEVARRIGITPHTLSNYIIKARKDGWLVFEDPLAELEFGIVPKVVRNLNRLLDEGSEKAILETAKGTIFKQYQDSKGLNQAPTTILALKLELPETPGDAAQIVSGVIMGKPKKIQEAELIVEDSDAIQE